jgi:3-deoxy-D-arabino-heptulosonate 7-phosphate (DAHP) synthase
VLAALPEPGQRSPKQREVAAVAKNSARAYEPLFSSPCRLDELALDDALAASVEKSRAEVRAVLDSADDRLLVVAGRDHERNSHVEPV